MPCPSGPDIAVAHEMPCLCTTVSQCATAKRRSGQQPRESHEGSRSAPPSRPFQAGLAPATCRHLALQRAEGLRHWRGMML